MYRHPILIFKPHRNAVLSFVFRPETDDCVCWELDQVDFVDVLRPSKRKLLDEDVCYLELRRGWF